ncbi:DMT family transporter [Tropicimonas sp. IMCC34011]|uniref:DMT family transporter n=1 Tax=Tropicimonas sp. IMCC34011 TaxID=2248759 RepID=UPI001E52C2E9|nr:DMT family transporter [Tropicimonas sp. IMCC34011]
MTASSKIAAAPRGAAGSGPSDMDLSGAGMLVAFSVLLGFNQVLIAVVNEGIQPIFAAGLRSVGAGLLLVLWMRLKHGPVHLPKGTRVAGFLIAMCFTVEFVGLYLALDLTTVTRTSVIFYSMPLWLAVFSHLFLPGQRLGAPQWAGIGLAFCGVVVALTSRGDGNGGGEASLLGDLCALLGALGWSGIALCARGTALVRVPPHTQLLYQLSISAPILLAISPLFGPVLRDPTPLHWAGLGVQASFIAFGAYLFWLWILTRYRAAQVAAFSFLSPIFGAGLGWALLGEELGPSLGAALVLVCAGLILINRPARRPAPL